MVVYLLKCKMCLVTCQETSAFVVTCLDGKIMNIIIDHEKMYDHSKIITFFFLQKCIRND